jgi:hypothetical protein
VTLADHPAVFPVLKQNFALIYSRLVRPGVNLEAAAEARRYASVVLGFGSGSLFSLIDTGFRREGACLAGDEVGAMTWYRSVLTPAVFVTELCFWEIRSGNG